MGGSIEKAKQLKEFSLSHTPQPFNSSVLFILPHDHLLTVSPLHLWSPAIVQILVSCIGIAHWPPHNFSNFIS